MTLRRGGRCARPGALGDGGKPGEGEAGDAKNLAKVGDGRSEVEGKGGPPC